MMPWEEAAQQSAPQAAGATAMPWEEAAQAQQQPNLAQRISSDLGSRVQQGQQIVNSDLNPVAKALAYVGKVGAGTANDALSGMIPQAVKDLAGSAANTIEQGASYLPGMKSYNNAMNNTAQLAGDVWKGVQQNHPNIAASAEGIGDIGQLAGNLAVAKGIYDPAVAGGKAIVSGVTDNPTIATRAAAGEVDKSVPAVIAQQSANMTSDDLRAISSNIYQKADAAGGALSPDFTNKFVDDITKAASEHIKTPEDAAQAAAWGLKNPAADLISGAQEAKGLPMSLNIATSLDQKLGDLVHDNVLPDGKLNSSGREYSILQGKLRDAIKNAPPEQFVGGRAGFDASADARKAWMYQAQMRDLERIEAKAAGQEVGGNALRRGMYSYVTNPARSGSLEPSDFALAQKAGSKSITGEVLKTTGSGLVPYVTTVLGSAGGVPGAALGMTIGKGIEMGSKAGAEALQSAPLNALKKSLASKTLALAAKYK